MSRGLRRTVLAVVVLVGVAPLEAVAQPSAADNHIAYYERLLRRSPSDARTYHRLGDAFIRKARETGDLAYFTRAESALQKSLELAPGNAGARRHLAYVFYSRHEFDAAVSHATQAVMLDPHDDHAYGVLGDAYLELGRYDEAATAYRSMMAEGGDTLYGLARLAGLKSMRGDPRGAIADLSRALDEARRVRAYPAETVAWTAWQLGAEHFAVGDLAAAEAGYRTALTTQPGYYRALAGLAQVRAAQARDDEAIALYRQALAVIPLPEYAAALGDVYARAGKGDEARKQYELVEYIARLTGLDRAVHNRELAFFYADHDRELPRALELARLELDVRKDIHAYDLLAWALYKNGDIAAAVTAITEALKLGTEDAKLFFHAGLIHRAAGNAELARDHLRRALVTNPHFHVMHAREAREVLARMEDESTAATAAR